MTSSLFPRCHRPPPGTGTGTGAGAGKGALGGREGRAWRCPEGAEHGPAPAGGGGVSAARPGEVGTAAERERVGAESWGVAGAPRGRGCRSRGSRRFRRLLCRSPVSSKQFGLRLPRRRGGGVAERGWMRTGRPGGRGSPRASHCERPPSDGGEPPPPAQRGAWGQLRAAMPRRAQRDQPAPRSRAERPARRVLRGAAAAVPAGPWEALLSLP